GDPQGGFDARRLSRAHPALQREAIASLLRSVNVAPDFERIEEVRGRLGADDPYRASIGPELYLRILDGRLVVARREPRVKEFSVTRVEELPKGVDPKVLELPELVMRSR